MPTIPASTKTSLIQRFSAYARRSWPQLAAMHVRYHGQLAYVTGELTDGEQLPLMRPRYGDSARRWGAAAIYTDSTNTYENQIWSTGSIEESFDLVCDLKIGPIAP